MSKRFCGSAFQFTALEACNTGDEREVIILVARVVARAGPRADRSVIDRLRIVGGDDVLRRLRDGMGELVAHEAEVGRVVVDAKGVDGMLGIGVMTWNCVGTSC